MHRDQQGWFELFRQEGAYWDHDGNPKRPHVALSGGKHSDGFFNIRLVNERYLKEAASDLVEVFASQGGTLTEIQCIVGPQTGATKLAKFISEAITHRCPMICLWASPAKGELDGKKVMVLSHEGKYNVSDGLCTICEDVLTLGGSIELTATAVKEAEGEILPYLFVLVNRSGISEMYGKRIFSLLNYPMSIWEPNQCPLCEQGSEAILRPKDNWERLITS